MLFHPKDVVAAQGKLVLSGVQHATAHACLRKPVFEEFWHNFTFESSTITLTQSDEYVFFVGMAQRPPLNGYDYAISIEPTGLFLCAKDERSLIQGFMTLLDRFKAVDADNGTAAEIACCQLRDRASIQTRMVHFCIFPESELWEVQRFVRLCGALKYTHVILEFFGMLKFDCLKELAWSCGFTKQQIRPIIDQAHDLGIEIVPMFNHWGHASGSRMMHGKHVVLDQNPSLQPYFSEDGWCWDIQNPKVRALLRDIRAELIELCGAGNYFHIGCDEAIHFEFTEKNLQTVCDFINEIGDELHASGRRAIVWGDMMLYRHAHYNPKNNYSCNAPTPEVEQFFLSRLHKHLLIADWQYWAPHAPIETASVFQNAGFDCLLCPCDIGNAEIDATLATIYQRSLMGFIHTTWHTLTYGMPCVTQMGVGGYEYTDGMKTDNLHAKTATLLRKVMSCKGDYERAGWSHRQIDFKW